MSYIRKSEIICNLSGARLLARGVKFGRDVNLLDVLIQIENCILGMPNIKIFSILSYGN